MVASIVAVIYFSSGGEKVTAIAKQDEFLEKKRFHNNLCAPNFGKEIEDLGNKGAINLIPKSECCIRRNLIFQTVCRRSAAAW